MDRGSISTESLKIQWALVPIGFTVSEAVLKEEADMLAIPPPIRGWQKRTEPESSERVS